MKVSRYSIKPGKIIGNSKRKNDVEQKANIKKTK